MCLDAVLMETGRHPLVTDFSVFLKDATPNK